MSSTLASLMVVNRRCRRHDENFAVKSITCCIMSRWARVPALVAGAGCGVVNGDGGAVAWLNQVARVLHLEPRRAQRRVVQGD